jgi:MerR family transcriptional regulator, copper efflux regulator
MTRTAENQPHRLPLATGDAASRAAVNVATSVVEEGDEALLQVGDLARLSSKTVRAIHLYEELGLLKPHARSKGRYRLFSQDAVVRVRWIGKLQDLGLSLSTIQTVVREWETSPSAPGAMAKMREVYRQKLDSTREQIEHLRALEAELDESLKYLETCDTCDPVRLFPACTCCDLHEQDQHPPELVAGFRAT